MAKVKLKEGKGCLEQLEGPALLQLLEDDLQVPEAAPGLLHVSLKGLPSEQLTRVGKVLLEREERLQQTFASEIPSRIRIIAFAAPTIPTATLWTLLKCFVPPLLSKKMIAELHSLLGHE